MRRAVILGLVLVSLPVVACGSEDTKVDDPDLSYSFSHPEGFGEGKESDLGRGAGLRFEDKTVIGKGDGGDLIAVQTAKLARTVTPELRRGVNRLVTQLARRTGSVRSRKQVEVAGAEAFQFRLELRGGGTTASALSTYLPKGRTLYWIFCQWQRERKAVLEACDEALDTFETKAK